MSLDASWIIDDSKQHIITCTDKGLRGILFGGHAWQAGVQSTPLLYTARDWEEVSDVILGVSDVYASNSTRQTAVVADSFRDRVEELVSLIPKGRVMTYGQLAVLSGSPRAARIVGGIAHYGNPDLPWHRVVNRHGGTAVGFPGGRLSQQKLLQAEGIVFDEHDHLNIMEYQWRPL